MTTKVVITGTSCVASHTVVQHTRLDNDEESFDVRYLGSGETVEYEIYDLSNLVIYEESE